MASIELKALTKTYVNSFQAGKGDSMVSQLARRLAAGLWTGLLLAAGLGAVQVNPFFADYAVLQREAPVVVWGVGEDGEKVTVEIGDQTKTTVVVNGKWPIVFAPMPAGGPYEMHITGSDGTRVLQDIWYGDVFLISGQSNMDRKLDPAGWGGTQVQVLEKEIAKGDRPLIRHF